MIGIWKPIARGNLSVFFSIQHIAISKERDRGVALGICHSINDRALFDRSQMQQHPARGFASGCCFVFAGESLNRSSGRAAPIVGCMANEIPDRRAARRAERKAPFTRR